MDEIPVSLALAQAAKETVSTSRFAQEGNALFGQWTGQEKLTKDAEKAKNKDEI